MTEQGPKIYHMMERFHEAAKKETDTMLVSKLDVEHILDYVDHCLSEVDKVTKENERLKEIDGRLENRLLILVAIMIAYVGYLIWELT